MPKLMDFQIVIGQMTAILDKVLVGFASSYIKIVVIFHGASELQTAVHYSWTTFQSDEAKALSLACNERLILMSLLQEQQVGVMNFKMFADNQACVFFEKRCEQRSYETFCDTASFRSWCFN